MTNNTKPYIVEEAKDAKGNRSWIVRGPDGHIANRHYHPNKKDANNHAKLCNTLFGVPDTETGTGSVSASPQGSE